MSTSSVGGWHKYIQEIKEEYSDNGSGRGGSDGTRDKWYRWYGGKEEIGYQGRVNNGVYVMTTLTGIHNQLPNSHAAQRSIGKRREAATNTNEHIPIRLSRQRDRMGGNISRDGDTRQRRGQGLSYLLAHGGTEGMTRLVEGGHWTATEWIRAGILRL